MKCHAGKITIIFYFYDCISYYKLWNKFICIKFKYINLYNYKKKVGEEREKESGERKRKNCVRFYKIK